MRLFSGGLSSTAKRIGVKIADEVYFKEGSAEEPPMPATIKISQNSSAFAEVALFLAVFVYLCAVYAVATYLSQLSWHSSASKVSDS